MSNESKKPKRKRRWLRFSLRTFLIIVTILCVWLAWYVHRVERQKKAVAWVEGNGGTVLYDYEYKSPSDSQPPGPKWMHDTLGVDYFATVVYVEIINRPVDDVTPLASLTRLKELILWGTFVSDVTPLESLTNLEELQLPSPQIRDITPLASMTKLRKLTLWRTQVVDLTPLSGLTNLKELQLHHTPIKDISPLKSLNKLFILNLDHTQVHDLTPLRSLINLGQLQLEGTNVDKEEIDQLQLALPDCDIYLY